MESTAKSSWQRDLVDSIRDSAELLSLLRLPPETINAGRSSHGRSPLVEGGTSDAAERPQGELRFPVLVPRSFLDRMQPECPDDPLLLQVLPVPAEDSRHDGFVSDAVGDLNARRAPGMIHKYSGRALLISTGSCAIHCRYCFRREYPYQDDPRGGAEWEPALREISEDVSITEVILSGGDPLMLNDTALERLCRRIDEIPHIERIRLHTRLPIVLPSRTTLELLRILTTLRARSVVVVHANHPAEIQRDCVDALRMLVSSGIPILNQAVLLRRINDSTDIQEELCRRLINLGVMPYYLHQLDRVHGTAHFEVDEAIGRRIIAELTTRLPGYAVPRYVREIAGEPSKTAL